MDLFSDQKVKKFRPKGLLKSKPTILVFAVIFASVGVYLLISSFAATPDQFTTSRWLDPTEFSKTGRLRQSQQILQVDLSYNAKSNPKIHIVDLKSIKNGHAPRRKAEKSDYKVQILNSAGTTINSQSFEIPNHINSPPPLNKNDKTKSSLLLTNLTFSVTLNLGSDSKKIRILSPDNKEIASSNIVDMPATNAKRNFRSLPGEAFRLRKKTSLLDKLFSKTAAATTSNTLDLVFIGDDYSIDELTKFHDDVNQFTTTLLSYEPYKSRAHQISFHYIDNTENLDCRYNGRLLTCDSVTIMDKVNTSGTPWDKIAVIENNDAYGGSGGNLVSVSYNGELGAEVFVHETGGHSIGDLHDEYISDEGSLFGFKTNMANCSNAYPAQDWASLVADNDYRLGCDAPYWYASSPCSVMSSVSCLYFNVISQRAINEKLDFYAAPYTNTINPTASITSPASGSTVSNGDTGVNIDANLADDSGIARAELWKDGSLFQTIYTAPYSFSWYILGEANNSTHSLLVKVYDTAGSVGASSPVNVIVSNPNPDTQPPSTPTGLKAEASAHNVVNLSWSRSSDSQSIVSGYYIVRNGKTIGRIPGYYDSIYSDATVSANTSYSYQIIAYDEAINKSSPSISASVTTPVQDITPPTAPTNLVAEADIQGRVNLSWNASTDNRGVDHYFIYRNYEYVAVVDHVNDSIQRYVDEAPPSATPNDRYFVYAVDKAGNFSDFSNYANVKMVDTTPPTAPLLTATAASYNKVSLSWTASSDNKGVAGYYIIRNGTTIAQTTSTTASYDDNTVSAKSSYSYQVVAYDAAGNSSSPSNTANVTTPSPPDTQAPTVPTKPKATAVSSFQVNLSWTKSTDNVGVTVYDVYRGGRKIATVTTTSFGDASTFASTSYNYYVKARDAAGNTSAASATVSATTPLSTKTGTLKGTVYGNQQGKITAIVKLAGASITVTYKGTKHVYTANTVGTYQIIGLPAISYSVKYSKTGYSAKTYTASITAGKTTTQNATLVQVVIPR